MGVKRTKKAKEIGKWKFYLGHACKVWTFEGKSSAKVFAVVKWHKCGDFQ